MLNLVVRKVTGML